MKVCAHAHVSTRLLALAQAAEDREPFIPAAENVFSHQDLASKHHPHQTEPESFREQSDSVARTEKRQRSPGQLVLEKSRNDGSWQNVRPNNQPEQVSTGQNGKNSIAKVNRGSNRVIAHGIHEALSRQSLV